MLGEITDDMTIMVQKQVSMAYISDQSKLCHVITYPGANYWAYRIGDTVDVIQ